jgi:Zn-dependent M28 family amino/carboxypeptidase
LAVLALIFIAIRLITPQIGPAAGYVSVARTFDSGRAIAHIEYFADPARAGRFSGSPGYVASAEYMADQFRGLGLQPLGDDGSYFQRFKQTVVSISAMPTLELVGPEGKAYVPRRDFTERVGGRAGAGVAEGNVVYVGGGIRNADYSDYKGTHPEGNIVLIAGPTDGDPIDAAIRAGAKGVIFVTESDADVGIIKFSAIAAFERQTVPVVSVTEAVADELIAGSGKRIADLRHELEERQRRAEQRPSLQRVAPEPLSFDTSNRVKLSVSLGPVHEVDTMNVVGMLRGNDAERAKKFLIIGGHLDGVGVDPNGALFPAANDNASGPAVTIEIARVLVANRALLGNSFIFVGFAGEEEGLVGSEMFVQHSITRDWRPDNVVAFVNLDMNGCCGGLAASDEVFALHDRLKNAAERLGYSLDYTPPIGTSDHFSYLRRRVPAITVGPTEVGPFHTTGDDVRSIDPDRLRESGEVVLQAMLEMGASQ